MDAQHQDLLTRCLEKDQRAQTEIYKRYAKAMYNVALRIVKDAHYAEDVMQESFLKAFTKIQDYKQEVTFGAWLKRIVINSSIDFVKKQKRVDFQDFETVLMKVKNTSETIDSTLDFQQVQVQQVITAINQLRPSYQLILTLHFIEGYDHEEVMQILNINYSNCRTTLSRAKESLKKKLTEL